MMAILLMISVFAGCGSTEGSTTEGGSSNNQRVQVSLLIGKEEIAKELNETVATYNDSQDKYEVKIIPLARQNATEKITSLYASKNVPVLMNVGVKTEIEQWKDKFLDLSDMEIVQHIDQKYLEAGTIDGKLIGIPVTVEAFGYLYNKDVLDEAVNGDFDPASIQSRTNLEALMESISKLEGKNAIEISPMDWSLGAHFTSLFFTDQSENADERMAFMEDLKSGTIDLNTNIVFQNWVDTFDLMKQYNAAQKSPLSADYDSATLAIWQMEILVFGLWGIGLIHSYVKPTLISI